MNMKISVDYNIMWFTIRYAKGKTGEMNYSLQWRDNERNSVSNHQTRHCLLNRLFKASRHWPLWGESPLTGEFPAQMASNAENVTISWRHHVNFQLFFQFTLLELPSSLTDMNNCLKLVIDMHCCHNLSSFTQTTALNAYKIMLSCKLFL